MPVPILGVLMTNQPVIHVPVLDLTMTFMRCATCFGSSSSVPDLSPLWPPRGWAGPPELRAPTVLVVSLNPGHPLSIPTKYGVGWDEAKLLHDHGLGAQATIEGPEAVVRRRTAVTREAAQAVVDICWRCYDGPTPARDHLFHRRSVAYARACLWLAGVDEDWRAHCWFTDIVKCSTTTESGTGLPEAAITNCRRHLVREIEVVQPKIIAVLGHQAVPPTKAAALEAGSQAMPVVFRHPARWRRLTDDIHMRSFRRIPKAPSRREDSAEFRGYLKRLQDELEKPPG
jgi:hypothetical protein